MYKDIPNICCINSFVDLYYQCLALDICKNKDLPLVTLNNIQYVRGKNIKDHCHQPSYQSGSIV
jgi:hypothetical protein